MALGQLQHLEGLFVTTGWLSARCESFNAENAHAIANRTKFRQDTNLYALDTFVVTPMSKPGMCGARERDEQQTIAEAHGTSSFSELVNPFGLFVHCFVSHFWGHNWTSTVTALDLWADANYDKMTSEKEALVYWICLFALNQHDVAEEVGENPQQGPFNAALAQATGGAVMVLDEEVKPFSRIWCLFEASRLKDLHRPFELICSEGSLSQPENGGRKAVSTKMLETTCQALWNVSAANAESSVAKDKYQIWSETANESIRGAIKGMGAELWFKSVIDDNGADALAEVFSDFDRYMNSLLSTAVLKVLMARGDFASAATCCLQGADVSSEQLAEICSSFAAEIGREDWLNSMLLQASNPSMAKLLLEKGADARAARHDGFTALMWAAVGGHEAVAQLLLQHGGDARAAQDNGFTALMAAAQGHVAVAQLLLQHSADVRAAQDDGATALMWAAVGGHGAVAQLLLQHGADVAAARNDGETALMLAADNGHEAVARLLLQHGADVAAAGNNGFTALMLAAQGGHEAMAQLLLQHGADVAAARNDGRTALMLAAQGGHEAMARLLLQHGADVRAAMHDGATALMWAAVGGHEAVAKLLLRNDGATALMLAAQGGHEAVAQLLLQHGADVAAASNDGHTALMRAADNGHGAVAQLLLQHGADVAAASNDGITALMRAALRGHEAVAKLLLQHGADVAAARNDGSTALMLAALVGHEAVAQLLLQHGADVAAASNDGRTALMIARANRHEAVARLLREHGGDQNWFRRWLFG